MTLLLTLCPDSKLQQFFEQQRQKYFPQALNKVPAHIMLFHQLPESEITYIKDICQKTANGYSKPPVTIDKMLFLGKGVAYNLQFDTNFYYQLKNQLKNWLIPQDLQPYKPHVTIQNKVSPLEAKTLYTNLQDKFTPFSGCLIGLMLWKYRDGYWDFDSNYYFN